MMILKSFPVSSIDFNINTLFIDTSQELLGGEFTIGQFIEFLALLILAIVLAFAVPYLISTFLSSYLLEFDKKEGQKYKDLKDAEKIEKIRVEELQTQLKFTLIKPLRKLLGLIIFVIFGLIAFFRLGYELETKFYVQDYPFQLIQFIFFFIIIAIFTLFINTTLSPVIRVMLNVLLGRRFKRADMNNLHKGLLTPFTYLFILLMIYSAVFLSFPPQTAYRTEIDAFGIAVTIEFLVRFPYYDIYETFMTLLAIIIGTYFITSIFLTIFQIRFTIPKRMDRHATVAFENLVKVMAFLLVIALIGVFFGVEQSTVAIIIGAIGFAIAFGMQNTIANIMSGFALAADRPFKIGDRVRVGGVGRETWGDVVDIGLNTTKIRTVEEETVVLPNNYIANNEIWNFTKGSPIIALTFPVGISYGSNWRLAKKLMIEEMRKHPYILRKPESFVRIDTFGDFSINLIAWAWIRNARDKDQIRSDLLEAFKDRFDAEGVEIPFPYRTVVFKKDIPVEKQLPVGVKFDNIRRYPSKGRDYFEIGEGPLKGIPVSKVVHEEDVKILTPVSGIHNAKQLAEYSMSLARKINGNVTALYIMKEASKDKEMGGLKALSIFENYGTKFNINVATRIEVGEVVNKILEIIDKDRINLVVIGGGRSGIITKWGHGTIANEIIERSTVPVVVMPYKLKWY